LNAYKTDRSSRRGDGVLIGVTTSLTSGRILFDIPIEIEIRKFFIFKPWQIHIDIEPESNISDIDINNIPDNENTLEENIIAELTNHLHSIYTSVPMNRDESI